MQRFIYEFNTNVYFIYLQLNSKMYLFIFYFFKAWTSLSSSILHDVTL